MKKTLSLIICLSIFISCLPCFALADEAVYGTKNNPVIISTDTSSVFYEAESYPDGSNYQTVSDVSASGSNAVSKNTTIDYTDLVTKGDTAQYRLWINSKNEGKIKIFLRMKTTSSNNKGIITCAKNDDPVMDRSFYFEKTGEYYWFCPDSYEVGANETFAFSMIFSQANLYVDKIFITSDLMVFPEGTEEISDKIDFSYMADYYGEPSYTPIATHPRLFINSESIKSIKANLEKEENIFAYNSLISRSDTTPTSNAFQNAKGYILSNAFLSVIADNKTEKEERANNAINTLLESLKLKSNLLTDRSVKENLNDVIYRIFFISLVYDWCYDYLGDYKDTLISNILFYMAQQEYTYPPINVSGVNNGHESEGDFFAGLLPAAIAIYNEYPQMYNLVGTKVLKEHVPTRNYYYQMNTHAQGSHYMRMTYEFYLRAILDNGVKEGIVNDGADSILMEYVFGLRPDNQIMRNGDHNASGTRDGIELVPTSLFYNSNYHNNAYLKDLYYRISPTQSFVYDLTSICEPFWLIFNNPSLKPQTYTELPLTYYAGDDAGVMYARTSWDEGKGAYSDTMAVRLNLETIYGAGHDHLDAGHFDIYYKGSLALDSGHYNTFTSDHNRNYYQRTIAHNSMLLYDENEETKHRGIVVANDGGQTHKDSSGETVDTLYERQKIGEILAADYYGEDMRSPSFSYMKGDLTDAYSSSKMEKYTRSFVFLNFFDETYPGALIVFDKMTSKNPEFKKTWLLHTQEEPEINGQTVIAKKTEEGDNGRLINTTLLPKLNNASIISVGRPGFEFSVNGTNYDADMSKHAKDYGQWRVELSPKNSNATDYFLNVLHVTENDDSIEPLTPELIETTYGNFKGVKIKNRIVLFNTSDTVEDSGVIFTFEGSGEYEILVAGVSSGKWNIQSSNASKYDTSAVATENGSDLYFKGTAGTYALRKETSSSAALIRNLDYKSYIEKSDDEISYIRFNGIYHTASFFEEDGKLFVGAEYISKYLDSPLEYTTGGLKYFNNIYSVEVSKDSEDVILKDGIYYVSPDALSDICFVEWTKENDYIYNLTISKREITKITSGNVFKGCNFDNEKALYVIEGTETLSDGTIGIKLPVDYETKSNFAGVIKGIEGKNNIEITGTKPLFYDCKSYYAKISNLTLKGNTTLVPEKTEFGVLIGKSTSTKDLVLENITNYLDVTSPDALKNLTCYAGGIIGYRWNGDTVIKNCINYGDFDCDYDYNLDTDGKRTAGTRVGGLISTTRNGKTIIKNSYNYGELKSSCVQIGGLHSYGYNENSFVEILDSGNYGKVSTYSTNSAVAGGLSGFAYNCDISNSFNMGNISGSRIAGGIAGSVSTASTIENSYNTGSVESETYYACGIAYKSNSNGTLNIKYCHNIGEVSGTYPREISNSADEDLGNFYINENAKNQTVGSLTNPVNVSAVNTAFYGNPANEDEQVTDPDTNQPITTLYFIVPTKFSFLIGLNTEGMKYGILLSETVSGTELIKDTCDIEIEGKRNVLGNFGILIYGNKVKSGNTYNVRPYVKYNDKYYYGDGMSFVFNK